MDEFDAGVEQTASVWAIFGDLMSGLLGYAFAFAGEGKSSESYPTFEVGVAQLVESAILGFNKSLVEKGGLEALQKASAPAAPQAAAAANPAGGAAAQAGGEPLDLAAPGKPASKAGKKRSK